MPGPDTSGMEGKDEGRKEGRERRERGKEERRERNVEGKNVEGRKRIMEDYVSKRRAREEKKERE